MTVDSDTSTSDTLLLFATGAAKGRGQKAVASTADTASFAEALNAVLKDLALQVVRDGEGARKMVEVTVEREKVNVEQAKVEVERQSLANKQEFEDAALKFELEKFRIAAEKEIRIAAANAMGQMLAKAQMQIFGDPSTMAQMTHASSASGSDSNAMRRRPAGRWQGPQAGRGSCTPHAQPLTPRASGPARIAPLRPDAGRAGTCPGRSARGSCSRRR